MTEVVNPTKNVAAMNTTGALVGVATSTTIFGINGTSSSGPWVLLKSYENITSNISIKELNQPGIRIVRTCRLFIYSNNTSEPRCDPPVFSGTFERSSKLLNAFPRALMCCHACVHNVCVRACVRACVCVCMCVHSGVENVIFLTINHFPTTWTAAYLLLSSSSNDILTRKSNSFLCVL